MLRRNEMLLSTSLLWKAFALLLSKVGVGCLHLDTLHGHLLDHDLWVLASLRGGVLHRRRAVSRDRTTAASGRPTLRRVRRVLPVGVR